MDIVYRHIVIVHCHIVIVYRRIDVVTHSSSHSATFRATVEVGKQPFTNSFFLSSVVVMHAAHLPIFHPPIGSD